MEKTLDKFENVYFSLPPVRIMRGHFSDLHLKNLVPVGKTHESMGVLLDWTSLNFSLSNYSTLSL